MVNKDGSFKDLVRAACQAEAAVRGMSDAPKMSIQQITHECLRRADASMGILNKLRDLLDQDPVRFRNSRSFVRQVMRWASAGRISSGVPRDTSRMSVPSREDTVTELVGTGFGLYLLWALACQNVAKKNPEIFGPDIDLDAYRRRYEEAKEKADSLIERVGQEFSPSDTFASTPDSSGRSLITFRIAKDKVSVYPLANAGRRLINHLLDSDPHWALPTSKDSSGDVEYAKVASG